MRVTFTRIHERGYSVTVEGPGLDPVRMQPAPGYDARLPHDAAHFIVENELGIEGGVFGQLAAGGTANTFFSQDARSPRKARKRGTKIAKANKKDALFSEHAIYAAQSRWEKHDIIPDTKIPHADIQRIIEKFKEFANAWSKLPVGGAITVEWRPGAKAGRKR
jgi:hypothetical protein